MSTPNKTTDPEMAVSLLASHRFLEIANKYREMKPLLKEYAAEIHKLIGCDAVGIRILHPNGHIPYLASIGFDRGFHELENSLCTKTDECMCVNVIRGTGNPTVSFYAGGSFVQNRTSQFLARLTDAENSRIRSTCHIFGYESLALIPIQMEKKTLGLIHVADQRPDCISPHQIKILEDTAMQLGEAVHRVQVEEKLWASYARLEDRVQERTFELTRINEQLRLEIEERKKTESALKLNESRLETLYRLNHMGLSSLQEVCDFVVEQGVRLTQSEYGYLFFMDEDETVLTVHAWSSKALATCTVPDPQRVYKVVETGLWGEAVRQRKPIITNDYDSSTHRRGIPNGHVPIKRHMNIPVFDRNRIVAVAGVANKTLPYSSSDVRHLELLMKGMWRHIQKLRTQQTLKESEEKLRFLTTQLLTAQEKERKRVSNELHDELGQALLTLKLQLRALEKKLDPDQDDLKADFGLVFRHINSVTENVRRLSKELSPSILEDLGLVAALQWMIKRVGKHHYIDIRCDVDALQGWFDVEKELILFRIFQEAITNVAKHARTRHAGISARRHDRWFTLTIEDKGCGFDADRELARNDAERGLGLTAMDERVRMLGGRLEVHSEIRMGSLLTVTIPVPSKRQNDKEADVNLSHHLGR